MNMGDVMPEVYLTAYKDSSLSCTGATRHQDGKGSFEYKF